jgi:hypothetical protein
MTSSDLKILLLVSQMDTDPASSFVGHKKAAGKIASGHTQVHNSELKTSWYLTPPDRGQQKTAHTKGYGGRKFRMSAFSCRQIILTLSAYERHKKKADIETPAE